MGSSQSSLKCSICLDVLTDPLSTPCGHNFCKVCLSTYWDGSVVIRCPLCQQVFSKRPELKINVLLRDLLRSSQSSTEGTRETASRSSPTQGVQCGVCGKLGRRCVAVSSCLHCEESYCYEHLQPHKNDPQLQLHELLGPVSHLQARVCKRHALPLDLVCHDDRMAVCVMCMNSEHQEHTCVPLKNRLKQKKAQVEQELTDVQQKIQERKAMVERFTETESISEANTASDVADVVKLLELLQQLLKLNQAALVAALVLLQAKNKGRCEDMKKKLSSELGKLESRQRKLEGLSQAVDGLQLLQSWGSLGAAPHTEDWSHISPFSDAAVGTARSAVNKMLLEVLAVVKNGVTALGAKELRRVQQYAVEVTLDPATAHRVLRVSDDGKEVCNGGVPQSLPDNPERFDTVLGVLAKQGFSSGAFYFEVLVEDKTSWDIGIAVQTVDRKGLSTVSLSNGFAVLMMRDHTLTACDRPPVVVKLPDKPQKIGVFVDIEEGEVGFYDVTNRTHIYSFINNRFPQVRLHPYLNTCVHESTNAAKMVITPVTCVSQNQSASGAESDSDSDSDSDLDLDLDELLSSS